MKSLRSVIGTVRAVLVPAACLLGAGVGTAAFQPLEGPSPRAQSFQAK